ncbi:MAG: hypothetical protein C5B54_06100 [Acidobacteria bacterium]|nr:MAG: hypothetical protein C5B54_06100 [Acidobacteriota bacterium]
MKAGLRLFVGLFLIIWTVGFSESTGIELFESGKQDCSQGNYQQALEKLNKAVTLLQDPESKASAYLAAGVVYQTLGEEEKAKNQFSQAIIANPNLKLDRDFYSPKTMELFDQAKQTGLGRIQKGKQLLENGQLEDALREISTGVKLLVVTSPQIDRALVVDAYFTTAQIYQTLNKKELAVGEFQKAIAIDPDRKLDPDYYSPSTIALFQEAKDSGINAVNRAKQLLAQKDYDTAIKVLEDNRPVFFAKATKEDASVLLANAYYNTKRNDKAAEEVASVLQSNPTYAPAGTGTDLTFNQFVQEQKAKAEKQKPKILVVRAKDNRAHELATQGFKDSIEAEFKEAEPSKAENEARSFSPQAIFVAGSDALRAVRKSKTVAPVIFVNIPRADLTDMKDSNVGGIFLEVPIQAQFSQLKALLPNVHRIGVLYRKGVANTFMQEAAAGGKEYGIEIATQPVSEAEDVDEAIQRLRDIDVLWMVWDQSAVFSEEGFQQVIKSTARRNIPVFALHESFVKDRGALFSVSSNFTAMGQQAADLLKKILSSSTVKVVPAVAPAISRVAVNLSVAKKLNVKINPNGLTSSTLIYQ